MARNARPENISTADCETDPFKIGRTDITPFAWGLYDGTAYFEFWGDDATEQFIAFLREYEKPLTIYAHNGGKFDWLFLFPWLSGDMMFIGGRLVKANLFHHEIRDSYANIPVALKNFGNKIEIDYAKMERAVRNKHKKEILTYMKQDNIGLYDAIIRWKEMFGAKPLTMASAAMSELKKSLDESGYKIGRFNRKTDERFRPFYFGGRVECFEKGLLTSETGFHVHDVNSSYPGSMLNYKHPISNRFRISKKLSPNTDFAVIEATSHGALPVRDEQGGVRFPWERRIYYATGHEIREALLLGILKIHRVIEAVEFSERISFADFVLKFYGLRNAARATDQMLFMFYKLVLNSAYGKFALNPDDFKKHVLLPDGVFPDGICTHDKIIMEAVGSERDRLLEKAWYSTEHYKEHKLTLWECPAPGKEHSFINVACAASITGASRAILLRPLSLSKRPVYCDTDSVICEEFVGDMSDTELGKWKYEGTGDTMAIVGKKNYVLFNSDGGPIDKKGASYKLACKGTQITPEEMVKASQGEDIIYNAAAPTFKRDGRQIPLVRTVKMTAKIEEKIYA